MAALFTVAKRKEDAAQMSTDGWTDTRNVVSVHNGILFHLKKNEILTHAITWINLEEIILNEMSQSQNKIRCNLTWGILRNQIHKDRK